MAIVYYKGKKYNVWGLGSIVRNDQGQLMDQLDETESKCMGAKQNKYLRDKLGLTQRDYYIIVVLSGDENKIPDCPYKGCKNKVKFGSLSLNERLLCRGCCEKHSRSLAESENNSIKIKNGTHNLLSRNRSKHFLKGGEYYSSVARDRAIKQVEDGNHPWAGENGTSLFHRRVEEGSIFLFNTEFSSNLQKERMSKGIHQFQMKEVDIKADRSFFLNKGSLTDTCYFYIAMVEGDSDNIKIGATEDPEYRSHFHHMKSYESIEIIRTGDRTYIANLEYNVKLKFKDFTSKGTETFPKEMKDEILEFINTL